ncbi:uncharacterized protein [Rhodnius prolixus]|uniref:uncharacterized protein n=1 Tax=Rhodnius prolixus TaxID=13249 RepID=UPI003D18ECA0
MKKGADPVIALLYYKATIRSVIDFGSIFYGGACKSRLKKLDVIQNKSIRTSLGYLNSTPVDVMLNEAGEMPLSVRRQMLADRYMIKLMSKSSPICGKLCHLSVKVLSANYWQKKISPLLVNSFTELSYIRAQMYSSEIAPIFKTNYSNLIQTLNIEFLLDNRDNPSYVSKIIFNANYEKHSDYYTLYTDGSKLDGRTGAAFYDPQLDYGAKFKLAPLCTVYSAELYAIKEALRYINTLNHKKTVIYTDSNSSLQKLQNFKFSINNTHLLVEILELNREIVAADRMVKFVWIRSHVGIVLNEKVDDLAREATVDGQTTDYRLTNEDVNTLSRQRAVASWSQLYANEKGAFYKQYNPVAGQRKLWFRNLENSNKRFISSMCRLRSNHAICGEYLYKIGKVNNNLCDRCHEVDSAEHIIMECAKHDIQRKEFFNRLEKELTSPYNYICILSSNNVKIYEILYGFMVEAGIKV